MLYRCNASVAYLQRDCLGVDTLRSVFDDVTAEELAQHRAEIAASALDAARSIASNRLARGGPGQGIEAPRITAALVRRDRTDPDYDRLVPFEKRWSLLTLRLFNSVAADPKQAVNDAVSRGASWVDIANTLGISRQTAWRNFSDSTEQS